MGENEERFPRENIVSSDVIEINDPTDQTATSTATDRAALAPDSTTPPNKKAKNKRNEGRRGGKRPFKRDARDHISPKYTGPKRRTSNPQFDPNRCAPLTWSRDPNQGISVSNTEEFPPRMISRSHQESMGEDKMELFRRLVIIHNNSLA